MALEIDQLVEQLVAGKLDAAELEKELREKAESEKAESETSAPEPRPTVTTEMIERAAQRARLL